MASTDTEAGSTRPVALSQGSAQESAPGSAPATIPGRDPSLSVRDQLASVAEAAGLHRVHMLAWRDLYDPEAGGSEVHAAHIAKLWAEAGIELVMRSSYAQGHPPFGKRDGYKVIRKAGRYMVFPRAAITEAMHKYGPYDGMVEIWNGMPFMSPVWCRSAKVVFLHHLHREMWQMTLPPNLARFGDVLEHRVAPPLYRRTRIVTLSHSSREELIQEAGFRPSLVSVVPPGIDPRFSPGGTRSATPLVVAVGRIVPVKRYDELIHVLAELKVRHPALEAVIVGEGYEKPILEELVESLGVGDWLTLAGRLSDDEVVDLYRRAWVLASASAREGWGMTITEAAACGTPAVATRISGHLDAMQHGVTGLLADTPRDMVAELDAVLGDEVLRQRLSRGALLHASQFTWANTAIGTLEALAADAHSRRRRRR